nr:uncharacterized protein LOC117689246 isoform X5 [Crassostrea gigas]
MDERHRMHEEHEKARKEKHSEWHRKKDEELRRRLLKVYGNGSEINYDTSMESAESAFSNWTPKFDGDVRPRAGLVFVEPKLYNEYLKEEAQVRHQTAMMARSRSTNINTLEDDATVLETVET